MKITGWWGTGQVKKDLSEEITYTQKFMKAKTVTGSAKVLR